jgi:thiol-disulfide isomerase/thioredoxin
MRALALGVVFATAVLAAAPDAGVPTRPSRTVRDVKLLYFHASWCSSCKVFEAAKVLDRLDPALTVEGVDVDTNGSLLTTYGVTHTPTLVLVDREGFPLGRPVIDLEDGDATLARVQKLVRKMTTPR